MKIGIIVAAAAGCIAGPALAQSASPAGDTAPAQAETQASAAASAPTQGSFTAEEIARFAKAATKIGDIQQNATLDDSQKQVAMAAAVEESGLEVTRFNAMSQASRSDPALQKQVQEALVDAQAKPIPSGSASASKAQPQ